MKDMYNVIGQMVNKIYFFDIEDNINYKDILIPVCEYDYSYKDTIEKMQEIQTNGQLIHSYIYTLVSLSRRLSLFNVYHINKELVKLCLDLIYENEIFFAKCKTFLTERSFKNINTCIFAYLYSNNLIKDDNTVKELSLESIGYSIFSQLAFSIEIFIIKKEEIENELLNFISIVGKNFYKLYWQRIYELAINDNLPADKLNCLYEQFTIQCFSHPILTIKQIKKLLKFFYEKGYTHHIFIKFLNDNDSSYVDEYKSLLLMREFIK